MSYIPLTHLDWKYQARIDVINPNVDPLYQSVVVIPWTPGMNQDFSDLRFLHPRTGVVLPYWIESKTDGVTATIWIRGATASTVTVLFGNLAAASESDGEAVFEFFDDFLGSAVDSAIWDILGTPTITVSDGALYIQITDHNQGLSSKTTFGPNHAARHRTRAVELGTNKGQPSIGFGITLYPVSTSYAAIYTYQSVAQTICGVCADGVDRERDTAFSASTSYAILETRWLDAAVTTWMDGIQQGSGLTTRVPADTLSATIGPTTNPGYAQKAYIDWFLVRRIAATEPTLTFVPNVEVIPFMIDESVLIFLLPFEPLPSNVMQISARAFARLLPPKIDAPGISLVPESSIILMPASAAEVIELLPATLPLTTYPPAAADEIDLTPGALPARTSFEISQYKFERLSITRSIQDALWVCTGTIDGHVAPSTFQYFSVKYPDRNGTERVLFYGFIPGRERITAVAGNKTEIQAYDASYYLTRQLLPPDDTVYPAAFWGASGIINELLGGDNWARRTGIRPYVLDAPDYGAYPQKDWEFRPLQSRLSAILDVAEYHQMIFLVKTRPTSSGGLEPSAYFVRESQIDWALGLPPMVTFTGPDNDDILDVVRQQLSNDERYNHIEVYSPSPTFEGVWYHAVKRTPGLIAGTEIPLEYREIRPDFQGSAALCEARATELYNYYIDPAYSYVIRLLGRVDLELYQQVKFVGFSSLPTDIMRITRITYDIFPTHAEVEIEISPSSRLADARRLQRSQQASAVSEIQTIARAEIEERVGQAEVGEVSAVDGTEVEVDLERGVTVIARTVGA